MKCIITTNIPLRWANLLTCMKTETHTFVELYNMRSIHDYQRLRFSSVSILKGRWLPMIVGLVAWGMPSNQVWSQTTSNIRPSQLRVNRAEQQLKVPAKIVRYSQRLIQKYDKNQNGSLEKNEWAKMHGNPHLADANGDSIITVEELIARVFSYGNSRGVRLVTAGIREADKIRGFVAVPTEAGRNGAINDASIADNDDTDIDSQAEVKRRRWLKFYVPVAKLPPGVPAWFLGRDRDGDAQLTLSEYAPTASRSALEEFVRYDLNRDGILTGKEFVRAAQQNDKAKATTTGKQK